MSITHNIQGQESNLEKLRTKARNPPGQFKLFIIQIMYNFKYLKYINSLDTNILNTREGVCVLSHHHLRLFATPWTVLPHAPGFSVHRILQAKILEWVAISFYRGSFRPRDRIWAPTLADRFFITEPHRKAHLDTTYDYIHVKEKTVVVNLALGSIF